MRFRRRVVDCRERGGCGQQRLIRFPIYHILNLRLVRDLNREDRCRKLI